MYNTISFMKSVIKKLFSENVKQYPEKDAMEIESQRFSYHYFNELVETLATAIRQQNIKGKAIIVLNEHTVHTYASLLAIHFSDNTILPIEPNWPKQRIENILEQAKPAALIIAGNAHKNIFTDLCSGITIIDANSGTIIQRGTVPEDQVTNYDDIAYILFTSGTTGIPKGVPVKNENLNAFLGYYKSEFDFCHTDRFLQVYDLTFDVAYFSFLMPMCCGACCCIVSSKKGVPKYLLIMDDLINRHITVISMVPMILHLIKKFLKNWQAPAVRYSSFAGEALHHSEVLEWQRFVPNAAIHNFYGLTETTIVCTGYKWEKEMASVESSSDIVPIGKPFPGMKIKIVNEQNDHMPAGEVGELCFTGPQVIDGYLNGLHEEKFFEAADEGSTVRYYKTGDLVSLNQNGNLIFHGRADLQVKINGYRIELEEVEYALQKVVQEKCIVIKKKTNQNTDYLKAYIQSKQQDTEMIKRSLLQYLPDYMIPAQFEYIEHIPLSGNGKIDRVYLQSI